MADHRNKLYQYAVLYHPRPTKEQLELGEHPKAEVLTDITTVVAAKESDVGMMAARSIDEKYVTKLEDVEILVRPF